MYGHILVPTMVGVGGAGATNRLSLAKSLGAKTVIIVEGLFDRLSFVEHGIQQLANLTEQIKKNCERLNRVAAAAKQRCVLRDDSGGRRATGRGAGLRTHGHGTARGARPSRTVLGSVTNKVLAPQTSRGACRPAGVPFGLHKVCLVRCVV